MSIEKSLAEREKIKHRKPAFYREDWHKRKAACKTSWRKPTGKHSKMRHGFQGHPSLVNPGYGSPSDVRGLHSSGLMPVRVSNPEDLQFLEKKAQVAIIAASVGARKRIEMVKKASQLGLKILGIKNPAEYIKKIEEEFASRKATKVETEQEKKEKVKETKIAPKKEEKKEESTLESDAEEAKKKETKELEKVLTKRAR